MSTFDAELTASGKSATGIEVPQSIVDGFGAGKRVPVVVTINGYSYRSTVGPYRGANMLPVSAENRAGASIEAGQRIPVTLEHDTEPRLVEVPYDLAAALNASATARAAFDALSFSNQRAHVLQVTGAKTDDTRARRVAKVASELS
jgi:hypothetical protein